MIPLVSHSSSIFGPFFCFFDSFYRLLTFFFLLLLLLALPLNIFGAPPSHNTRLVRCRRSSSSLSYTLCSIYLLADSFCPCHAPTLTLPLSASAARLCMCALFLCHCALPVVVVAVRLLGIFFMIFILFMRVCVSECV